MNRGYRNLREATDLFDLQAATKGLEDVQAVAAADLDGHGALDLIVASGQGVYVLANTFENKPSPANDRRRYSLLTIRAPGRYGAKVALEDKDAKPLAAQRMGAGPAADTLYFGYCLIRPAAVSLTAADGNTVRQEIPPGAKGGPIVFK